MITGDFSDTGMGFDKSLQRFDEDVFKTILQSKFNSSSRSIVQVDDSKWLKKLVHFGEPVQFNKIGFFFC